MILLPPRSTRTYTPFPYTTLFLSAGAFFALWVRSKGPVADTRTGEADAAHRLPHRSRAVLPAGRRRDRSEEHTSELQSLMRISYAVFCLKKKTHIQQKAKSPKYNAA